MRVDTAREEGQSMLVTNKDAAIQEEIEDISADLKTAGIWTKPQQDETCMNTYECNMIST